jgi:4-amino-4-deoxy-L-arabinose transferase-like glycosyltransferase
MVVGATFVVAGVLRLAGLQSGMWYDEIVTLVLSARHPIAQIMTEFPGVNAHPLYSVLAHVSMAVFGESAWALRLPAALFGIASVVMVYVLAVEIMPRVEAWAATAVIATSYHHVWFSQNARGYTAIGFLTLFSTYILIRAARTGRRSDYVWYALACAAGVYTHLTMVFVVAGHAAVILIGHAARWRPARTQPLTPALWAWVGAAAISAAAYAPFIPGLIALMGLETTQQAAGVATGGWALSEAIRGLLAGTGVPAALVGGAFAAVGALSLWRRQPLLVALRVAPALVTAGALVILGQPLRPRFFFFLSSAAALFVGRGIGAVVDAATAWRGSTSRRTSTGGIVACTSGLLLLSAIALPTNYRVPKQDFDGAVAALDAAAREGAVIGMAGPACLPLQTYYQKADWHCLRTVADWTALQATPGRAVVVYTLSDYIEDPALRSTIRTTCRTVREFPATLGGGVLTICDVPHRDDAAAR